MAGRLPCFSRRVRRLRAAPPLRARRSLRMAPGLEIKLSHHRIARALAQVSDAG